MYRRSMMVSRRLTELQVPLGPTFFEFLHLCHNAPYPILETPVVQAQISRGTPEE